MPECKRITPEEAVAAYAKTGMRVDRGSYFERGEDGSACGCGMGAYALANLGVDPNCNNAFNEIDASLDNAGFTNSYQNGFASGFDGDLYDTYDSSNEFFAGYADGKAAWKAVSKEVGSD